MTHYLNKIAPLVQAMAQEAGARRRTMDWRRDVAVSIMEAWDARLDELRLLVQREQPWLVAAPLEPLRTAVPAPPLPPDVTVVATDGSSIDLDRHGLAQCYLINVGGAVIRYGSHPAAALTSCAWPPAPAGRGKAARPAASGACTGNASARSWSPCRIAR